jgi:hypothetical protein
VFETISEAFIQAGLEEGAVNYYPLSGQTIRLHDRSKSFEYDFPDRLTVLCRVSYFQDKGEGGREEGGREGGVCVINRRCLGMIWWIG